MDQFGRPVYPTLVAAGSICCSAGRAYDVWLMVRAWSANQSEPMPCFDHVLYAISYQLLSLRLSRTAHANRP